MKSKNSGQILIEAIVAIGVVLIGLLGVFGLLSRSVGFQKTVSDQYLATYLAIEGMELAKNLIDNDALNGGWANDILANPGDIYQPMFDDDQLERPINGSDPASDCNPAFLKNRGERLTKDPDTKLYGYGFSQQTNFYRGVCVKKQDGGNHINVKSITTFDDRGIIRKVELEDNFYNWR